MNFRHEVCYDMEETPNKIYYLSFRNKLIKQKLAQEDLNVILQKIKNKKIENEHKKR